MLGPLNFLTRQSRFTPCSAGIVQMPIFFDTD